MELASTGLTWVQPSPILLGSSPLVIRVNFFKEMNGVGTKAFISLTLVWGLVREGACMCTRAYMCV
jgi:hypothetical protein